jgi:undecaprenyl diphosphate synthase
LGVFSGKAAERKPDSVAIIMDGNGRWATRRGLPRSAGHVAGAKIIEDVVTAFYEHNVHHLTLYAFSTENWKRPEEEVNGLMELIYKYLDEVVIKKMLSSGRFSVKFLGDKSALPEKLRDKCIEVENMMPDRDYVCNIALNYGGRDEIVHAANAAIADGHTTLDEQILSRYMYTSHSPDPDLIIRTGGDFRISNFLLWQSAYSEYIILDTLWPDFGRAEIDKCIETFSKRKRRFGGLDPDKQR